MGGHRKRKSSERLERDDRKRFAFDRYDCSSYEKKYSKKYDIHCARNNDQSNNRDGGRTHFPSVDVKKSIGYESSPRYFNVKHEEPSKYGETMNSISSPRNYNSVHLANATIVKSEYEYKDYDNRRRFNFKNETYLNTLRSSKSRYVDLNELWKYLTDIRCDRSFSTAYDLTQELETSLKYYIDTRNEIIFLRKLHRHLYIPFSYSEINISNTTGFYNRINFLENESAYRSNRMNQLFLYLQSIVIPSVIDDIRYVHSISFNTAWANRARYWFHQFKQIKWEKDYRTYNKYSTNYRNDYYQRSDTTQCRDYKKYQNHEMPSEKDLNGNVAIKSKPFIPSKILPPLDGGSKKADKTSMKESKTTTAQNEQTTAQHEQITAQHEQITAQHEQTTAQHEQTTAQNEQTTAQNEQTTAQNDDKIPNMESKQITAQHEFEAEQIDEGIQIDEASSIENSMEIDDDNHNKVNYHNESSLILIEPNITVITVMDEDNQDTTVTANLLEKDN